MGAQELRDGPPKIAGLNTLTPDTLKALDTGMFFDFLAVRLNGPKADGKRSVLNWRFTDPPQDFVVNLDNATLTHLPQRQAAQADATLTLTRATLDDILLRKTTFPDAVKSGAIKVDGSADKLFELLQLLDTFEPFFPIVEPRRP